MEVDPRIIYALERTLLAWIRTGLAMMGLGFVVAHFSLFLKEIAQNNLEPPTPGLSFYFGITLIAIGVLVNVFSAVRHHQDLKQVMSGKSILATRRFSMGEFIGVLLGVLGALMLGYLIRLEG